MNLYKRFTSGTSFREFIDATRENHDLWIDQARLARVSPDAVDRLKGMAGRIHLLVLNEDWCGDAVNTVPFVARLAEEAGIELRNLGRDDNPDLMDAHLTGTSRSIPVVMVLDQNHEELGWWGPRPAALQQWVLSEGLKLEPEQRYREIRRWYARDKGATTVEEVVALIERVATPQEQGAA